MTKAQEGTMSTLDPIRERLAGVETKEPWKAWDRGIGYEIHCQRDEPINDGHRDTFKRGDAVFIAHSPSDVAYLLAIFEQIEAECAATDTETAEALQADLAARIRATITGGAE